MKHLKGLKEKKMKKIKVFYDPIEQIPVWLNKIARQGYRLKSVRGCLYSFDKTTDQVKYSTQFIGYDSNKKKKEYIDMLEDAGFKTFRAPLNQLNFAVGKIRLRPMAHSGAKVATTFDNYNKEILIVESVGDTPSELLTTNVDKSLAYKKTRNAYIQGLLAIVVIGLAVGYQFVQSSYRVEPITISLAGIVLILLIFVLTLALNAHSKYKKYDKESILNE